MVTGIVIGLGKCIAIIVLNLIYIGLAVLISGTYMVIDGVICGFRS